MIGTVYMLPVRHERGGETTITMKISARTRRRLVKVAVKWNMPIDEAASDLLAQKLAEIHGAKRR